MIENYITYYNNRRVQRNLGVLTPTEKYEYYHGDIAKLQKMAGRLVLTFPEDARHRSVVHPKKDFR